MVYASFKAFYENVIKPMRQSNPDHRRLDGWPSGGNREVVGRFRHQGRTWKVHADSHYEPLGLAYDSLVRPTPAEPFVISPTKQGARLDLVPVLQALRGTRHRHLYAYSVDDSD